MLMAALDCLWMAEPAVGGGVLMAPDGPEKVAAPLSLDAVSRRGPGGRQPDAGRKPTHGAAIMRRTLRVLTTRRLARAPRPGGRRISPLRSHAVTVPDSDRPSELYSPLHLKSPAAFLVTSEQAAVQHVPFSAWICVVIALPRVLKVPTGRLLPLPFTVIFAFPRAPLLACRSVRPSGVASLSAYFHPFGDVVEPSCFQQALPAHVPLAGAVALRSKLGVPVISNTQSA